MIKRTWNIILLTLSVFLSFFCSYSVHSQSELLDKKISIDLSQVTLEQALDIISNKAGFTFSYSDDIIPVQLTVSLSVKNKTVRKIFDLLFDDIDIEYTIVNNQIALKTSEEAMKYYTVSGYIRDEHSDENLISGSLYSEP